MAFVASNDKHGNQIMRVLLTTESEERTVASCKNVRINYGPEKQSDKSPGHSDHRVGSQQQKQKDNQNMERKQAQTSTKEQLQLDQQIAEQAGLLEEKENQKIEKLKPQAEQQDQANELTQQEKPHLDDVNIAAGNTFTARMHQSKIFDKGNGDQASSKHFESWLAAKNEAQLQQAEDRRNLAQQDGQRAEERARLAQLKYQSWLDSKTQKLQRGKSDLSSANPTFQSPQSMSSEASQRRLLEWEREKVAKLKMQRQQRETRLMQQQRVDCTRREMSSEAWQQWKNAARKKPRPVAMGCGLDSLRATNAPHFMNPNEWQSVLPGAQKVQPKSQSQPPLQWTKQSPPSQIRSKPDYKRLERLAQPRRSLEPRVVTKLNSSEPDLNVLPGKAKIDKLLKKIPNEKLEQEESTRGTSSEINVSETSILQKEQKKEHDLVNCFEQLSCEECQGEAAGEIEKNLYKDYSMVEKQIVTENLPLLLHVPKAISQRVSIVWSKNNIKRIMELRKNINILTNRVYREDQLELWRKQKEDQENKILSKKYQLKREVLRESFKEWLINGKLANINYNFQLKKPDDADIDDSLITQKPETDFSLESEDELQSVAPKSISIKNTNKNMISKKPLRYRKVKQLQNAKPWR